MSKRKESKKEIRENVDGVWKDLNKEIVGLLDGFKRLDEVNRLVFLNLIIGESLKASRVSPLNAIGLLSLIQSDLHNLVRANSSNAPVTFPKQTNFEQPKWRSYVG